MAYPNQYVPILKWKRAEQSALRMFDDPNKDITIPLIELVMPTVQLDRLEGEKGSRKRVRKTDAEISREVVLKFKERRMLEIPEEIEQSWGTRPVFVDFTLLYDYEGQRTTALKVNALENIISTGVHRGLQLKPVLNLNDDSTIKMAIASLAHELNQGICLRIAPSDLVGIDALNDKIETLLAALGLSRNAIDLLIDIKETNEDKGWCQQFLNASQGINNLEEWRTFIFASGAFPENLSKCRLDNLTLLPRYDWQIWLSAVKRRSLARNPIFSDYTIRNPIFNERLQYFNPTPSIKYTLENDWLILKGAMGQREHYLANAKLLVEDMPDSYYGEEFSWGDRNIFEKAKYFHQYMKDIRNGKIKSGAGTGRNMDWIAWGISHHLALVSGQIASLS